MSAGGAAFGLEAIGIGKRFGAFTALDAVDLRVRPGTVHALLGENGAGKSTLVKCLMGYYRPDAGQIMVAGREAAIAGPRDAHRLGIGMVYQHFTLVPSMTVAENLVMARASVPVVIDWRRERMALDEFLARMPFRVPLSVRVDRLAAGERQKLEILKQLYLDARFLILDEPTSVLTPDEADEVLGLLRGMTQAQRLTVLLITHKFREVSGFADDVTVLRKGMLAGGGSVPALNRADLAALMIGSRELPQTAARVGAPSYRVALSIEGLRAPDDRGGAGLSIDRIAVHAGEILGVAGISGNGQRELMEILAGQRAPAAGRIRVADETYDRSRAAAQRLFVNCLPEEPLRNASVARMSVADNLSFRRFDIGAEGRRRSWLDRRSMRDFARRMIGNYRIKTPSGDAPIGTLSGGNVQRAVLARELSGAPRVLIVANPCFGLDFQAVADIRSQIVSARNTGAAVLLISDDLDEILEISDRIVVMGDGKIVFETPIEQADRHVLGGHMAGHAAAA
jgi:general nucleoside transport system ATP-binding protein